MYLCMNIPTVCVSVFVLGFCDVFSVCMCVQHTNVQGMYVCVCAAARCTINLCVCVCTKMCSACMYVCVQQHAVQCMHVCMHVFVQQQQVYVCTSYFTY